jgi:hypothetical protein
VPAYTTKYALMSSILAGVSAIGCSDVDFEALMDEIRPAPMRLFMCRADMTFTESGGTRVAPEDVPSSDDRMHRWTSGAHKVGAELIFPYICNQSIKGSDPVGRKGFFAFYDRWEEYSEFIGPKPVDDPTTQIL